MYNDIVKDHFARPRNVGEMKRPDVVGRAKNEVDGDQVQLHFQIEDDRIVDVKMKVMGCVAAIASASLFTELIKGKKIEEAIQITKEELNKELGGLPENKIRCSLTCIDALQAAFGCEEQKIT
ncbi:iron-sulfur cluster assembly scaffold protein [bacterium]|nr:iron-sulfur cluster assembly scaffold protein [bacterium]RQV94336.1 MAG: iron-sulfur cluster assembly scaffold protein [bacterium]